jgi:transposase
MFSYISPEKRVPKDHPLRPIRAMVDRALEELSPRFDALYAKTGRPSIAPERLLRALLLQVLYTVRSERQLMEQLDYNLLFRWFVGLAADDAVWDATVFTKNRDRLLAGDVAQAFFEAVLSQAKAKRLLSAEHFTVDGTLIEAWASQKSLVRREGPDRRDSDDDPGNPTVNFRGEKRSNETHVSATDPEARLVKRKGEASRMAFLGHVLMENRNGSGGRRCADRSRRLRRAGGGARADEEPARHARCGSRLRRGGVRGKAAVARGDPARGAEHDAAGQRDRRSHDSPSGLRREPA